MPTIQKAVTPTPAQKAAATRAMHAIPFLQIEPTTRCNYSCGFCAGRHMAQGDLAPLRPAQLLEQMEGLRHVESQGEGEPLLHPEYFELVRMLRQRFPALGISTITNGSLFTEANIEQLLDQRFTRINISMESANPGRFRAIRGGSFERVERGLAAFMERRVARGMTAPTVGLAITVLRETVDETLDTILPFHRRLGLDSGLIVQQLQRMPQYLRFYDKAMLTQLIGAAEGQRFRQRAAGVPDVGEALQERGRAPGFYEYLYAGTAGRRQCPRLTNGLFLAQDGHLNPCCFVKDSAQHSLARPDEPLATALTRRKEMADQLARGETPAACVGCDLPRGLVSGNRPPR